MAAAAPGKPQGAAAWACPLHMHTAMQLVLAKAAQSAHLAWPLFPGCLPTHSWVDDLLSPHCSA